MYEFRTFLEAILHAAFCASDVHILNLCSLREVLYDGGAVEYRVYLNIFPKVACDITQHHMQSLAEQVFVGVGKIIE